MLNFSRYTHMYELNDAVALYHSLRMVPVYLNKEIYQDLQAWLVSPFSKNLENVPSKLKNEVDELIKFKILTKEDDEDNKVLSFVKSKIPKPMINVCYMVLSEQCNLACKYCFLGNNDKEKRSHFVLENMSKEVADQALEFFIKQIKLSGVDYNYNKPIIIFYGVEPLMNYEILVYISNKINSLRSLEPCLKNTELSMVTNGTLLTDERISKLKELGVSIGISIDGFNQDANKNRVDLAGKDVFNKILDALDRCKKIGANASLSVTLTEETINNKDDIQNLIDTYGIKSFGFNIMMSSENFKLSDSYNKKASQFIIDQFLRFREKGVYEDRIMRKLKSFTKGQIYFSDCAATAGGQIVISPTGKVGICHGCLHDKKYFVTDIYDELFNASENDKYLEWSQLTPVNKDECQECPALGICGGGCPVNAMNLKKDNTIHDIDERFCVHAKMTLEFLIKDLYRIIREG